MAKYVDGFVFVVPKNKVTEYKKMAKEGRRMWMKLGALDYKECIGDDMQPTMEDNWKHLTFPSMAKAKTNETVWFSFIVFKSKKHRDEVNKKINEDMKKAMAKGKEMKMPFDMKRFAYGGFEVMVE